MADVCMRQVIVIRMVLLCSGKTAAPPHAQHKAISSKQLGSEQGDWEALHMRRAMIPAAFMPVRSPTAPPKPKHTKGGTKAFPAEAGSSAMSSMPQCIDVL